MKNDNKLVDKDDLKNAKFRLKNVYKYLDIEYKTEDRIPNWIRDNVKWWLENRIDDQTFLLGIEYLIKENTMLDEFFYEVTTYDSDDSEKIYRVSFKFNS